MFHLLKAKPGDQTHTNDPNARTRVLELQEEMEEKRNALVKSKVMFVNHMLGKFAQMREQNEMILKMGGSCPDDKIPIESVAGVRAPLSSGEF